MASSTSAARVHIAAPSRIWNWVLAKQGLGGGCGLASVNSAAEQSLGLHSARVISPYVTAAARTSSAASLANLLGEVDDPALITIRCMRKTLHTLPVEMATYAHAATRPYRLRDVGSLARRSGLSLEQLEALAGEVIEHLGVTGRQSHRQIEQAVARNGHELAAARLALKLLWERGEVTYRNCSPNWNHEVRRFQLRTFSHPRFDPEMSTDVGIHALVEAYFTRYGPATLLDASWWSGLGQGRIAQALGRLHVMEMELPWAGRPFYMTAKAFEEYEASPIDMGKTGVNLLAHEDVALKAYFESRSRYLGDLAPSQAFNQIGEVRPTILHDGQVVGLWGWNRVQGRIRYCHVSGLTTPAGRSMTRKKVSELEGRLRVPYSGAEAASLEKGVWF